MVPKKVFLAEDDLEDQHLFIDFLKYRTDIEIMPMAENGVVALNYLEDLATNDALPDIIILDQNMPKRNGMQTLKILKENTRFADIPVMIYSTYTDKELINSFSKMGASIVLSKPLTKDGYDKMMDAFLDAIG